MVDSNPIVIVIDDDAAFRRSTERLIVSVGYKVQTFAAAGDFLVNPRPEAPACLLLDVRLPGLSGLDLQRELVTAGIQIPIIFITGHGDIPMSVQAMKAGAVGFLTKPFRQQDLLHRGHIMHKIMAKSLPDLVRMAGHLGLPGQGRDCPGRRSSRMLSASGARMLGLMNVKGSAAENALVCKMSMTTPRRGSRRKG